MGTIPKSIRTIVERATIDTLTHRYMTCIDHWLTKTTDICCSKLIYRRTVYNNQIKYHIMGTIPKSIRTIVERATIDTLTHRYMTSHFSALVRALK
jgi:hypothetical protein